MCVTRKVFLNLCDLFPVTSDNLKSRGVHKRMHFMRAMLRLDNHPKTKYRALVRHEHKHNDFSQAKNLIKDGSSDSILDKEALKALDAAAANAEKFELEKSPRLRGITDEISPPNLVTQSPLYDDEFLEAYFSDEDDRGVSAVEDLQGVMKRVSKKAALMVEAINACQTRMDSNFKVLKTYL